MRIYNKLVLIFFLLSFSLPHTVFAVELFGTIWYKGAPLQNKEITVKDKTVKTNTKGYYSINLEPGSYTLGIKLPDGRVAEKKADVFPQDTEKNFRLE